MSSSGGAAQAAGRRARPQSTRTPPTPRAGVSTRTQPPFPRTEEPAQATLLPLEVESFFREVGAGRPPTVHFSLPFTAADGRQTLLAMPGYTFAVPTPDTEQLALDTFSFLTLDRSEIGPEYKTPYIPRAPTYMPANATTNRPAMLVDEASGWVSMSTSM